MVQKIVLADDLDGTEGVITMHFAVGNDSYEIDLSEKNIEKFDKALKIFIDAARKVSAPASPVRRTRSAVAPAEKAARNTSSTSARSNAEHLAVVRAWAKANGHNVADRGRIAQSVQDAYSAANH